MASGGRIPRPPDNHLTVGIIGRPHGIQGEATAELVSENEERFAQGAMVVMTQPGSDPVEVEIVSSRKNSGRWLLRIGGVDSREAAEAIRGAVLSVPKVDARPVNGQTWLRDMVGLAVFDRGGRRLGHVSKVLEYPAQDLLLVETEAGQVLVPNVEAIVPTVDIDGGRIVVDPPAGMFD